MSHRRAASNRLRVSRIKIRSVQMPRKSKESLTFTCTLCKRDTNRDTKLHQLRDRRKARLIVAEGSIGDHKRETTHDIVPRHWPVPIDPLTDRSGRIVYLVFCSTLAI